MVCQSGTVVYVGQCPPGTRFHLEQRTCLDEAVCRAQQQRSVDREPRQIKFLLVDDNLYAGAWTGPQPHIARRQIKFRSVDDDPLDPHSDSADYDDSSDTAAALATRQIKFRSLPIAGEDDGHQERRQIKFRSLMERAIQPKKEERRQVKFNALQGNSPDQPLMTYAEFYPL